jgi:hypothetical protein
MHINLLSLLLFFSSHNTHTHTKPPLKHIELKYTTIFEFLCNPWLEPRRLIQLSYVAQNRECVIE